MLRDINWIARLNKLETSCYSLSLRPPSATICHLQASSRSAMKQSFEVHGHRVVVKRRCSARQPVMPSCSGRQVRLMTSWEKWRRSPRTRVLAWSTSVNNKSQVVKRSHFCWNRYHGCLDHYMIFPWHFKEHFPFLRKHFRYLSSSCHLRELRKGEFVIVIGGSSATEPCADIDSAKVLRNAESWCRSSWAMMA